MSTFPLVSIITPSFNQGQFLEATILSVLEQDYPNIEYIIVDGGSSDNSVEIIKRYADRLAFWVSEQDNGQAQAINKGLTRAQGEFLGWLNSDDVFLPWAISRIVNAFMLNPDIDVVYGRLERIDVDGNRVPTPELPKDLVTFSRDYIIDECVVNQPGCLWRRGMMEKVGHLNDKLHYTMDYDYWIRILLAGGKFFHLEDSLAQFRLSAGSKTVGQTAKMAREGLEVIEHYYKQPGITQNLGITQAQLKRQYNRGRGSVSLQAFYGCVKEKKWFEAIQWFVRAHLYSPFVLVNWKWWILGMSGLKRRYLK